MKTKSCNKKSFFEIKKNCLKLKRRKRGKTCCWFPPPLFLLLSPCSASRLCWEEFTMMTMMMIMMMKTMRIVIIMKIIMMMMKPGLPLFSSSLFSRCDVSQHSVDRRYTGSITNSICQIQIVYVNTELIEIHWKVLQMVSTDYKYKWY